MNEFDQALAEAETDAEIRAVVITGADGAFSVGEDISGDDPETAWPYGIPVGSSLNATYNKFRDADRKDILGRQLYRWQYPKPIVGAVSGWCLGAGSWLALTCHLTIAADDAVFGQPQVRHGANTDFIWVALAGFKNALRYSLTGDHVDAHRGAAHRLGEPSRAKRRAIGDLLPIRRTHRSCAAGDRENQLAYFHPGPRNDGVAQSMDAQQRACSDGALNQA